MNDPDDTDITAQIADTMGLRVGDVFTWHDGQTMEVVSIDNRAHPEDRDSLTVTDPTAKNPQDARFGQWGLPLMTVFHHWARNDITPGRLEVV